MALFRELFEHPSYMSDILLIPPILSQFYSQIQEK